MLLGGRRDAEQPEGGDADRGDRTGHRVEPRQVCAVHREAAHERRRDDGRHEHRGGDDGVSGRHGSDFMVPHGGKRRGSGQKETKTREGVLNEIL